MIFGGAAVGARAAYVRRKGASVLGSVLLVFAAYSAWGLHYYWISTPEHRGSAPPFGAFLPSAILIVLGVFFTAFFRYLYPDASVSNPPSDEPSVLGAKINGAPATPIPAPLPSVSRHATVTPWYRLFLLACAVGVALLAGRLAGIEDAVPRAQVVIFVLVLGCLATGLISEKTLTKIMPWKNE
jgi:hypothetical protein